MSTFKLCLNASTIMTTDIMTQIDVAQTTGFVAIELWFDHIDDFVNSGKGSVDDIRQALDDNGLAVPTCIYLGDWFDTEGEAYSKAMDEVKRRLAIAATIGTPHVIAGPPGGIACYTTGANRYRELLELGDSFGVKPAMEFLGFVEQLNTIEDAMEVMEKSGRNDATTVLDPFHIFRGGGDLESISKLSASQIAVSHFNDVPAEPAREIQYDKDRVWPGDGCFDLSRYLQLISETGYESYLSLELFREDHWAADPYEVVAEGYEKMLAVVND